MLYRKGTGYGKGFQGDAWVTVPGSMKKVISFEIANDAILAAKKRRKNAFSLIDSLLSFLVSFNEILHFIPCVGSSVELTRSGSGSWISNC